MTSPVRSPVSSVVSSPLGGGVGPAPGPGTLVGTWTFEEGIGGPSSGKWRRSVPNALYLNETDSDSVNRATEIGSVPVGDTLLLIDRADDANRFYGVLDNPIDFGTYWIMQLDGTGVEEGTLVVGNTFDCYDVAPVPGPALLLESGDNLLLESGDLLLLED